MSLRPSEAEVTEEGSGLLTLRASLERRQSRLRAFLRLRTAVALALLVLSVCGGLLALAFLSAGLGLNGDPRFMRWTSGFDAVLAVFLPGAFTMLTGRTGLLWWRGRHTDGLPPGDVEAGLP